MKIASTILALLALVGTATAGEVPSKAQKRHIDDLLSSPGERWATVRPSNMAVDGAVLCRDLETADAMTHLITVARGDSMISIITGGKADRARAPMPEPDLAAYGCVFLPAGTRVRVQDTDPVPFVEVDLAGKAIRGVVSPAAIELDRR